MSKNDVKVPKTLGACADRLYQLRGELAQVRKQAEALQAEYTAVKEKLVQELPKSEAQGVAGRLARATVVTKPKPSVKDWDALYRYIKKTGSFELLQRRVSEPAVAERWEAGQQVAGVEAFTVVDVSLNKL